MSDSDPVIGKDRKKSTLQLGSSAIVAGLYQLCLIAGGALALSHRWEWSRMTNFVVYLIGTLLVVGGLAYGASRLGISQVWIVAGALVIIGIGVMGGIVKTRQKEPSS
jgi:hypothetical protein